MPNRKKKSGECRPPLAAAVPGAYRVEVRPALGGKKRVLVCGCDEIRAYSREEVAIRHGKECVRILGSDLWCRTFGCRTAEVIGRIDEVRFSRAQESIRGEGEI